MRFTPHVRLAAAALLTVLAGTTVAPAADVGDIVGAGTGWLVAQAQSQQRVDALAEQRRDIEDEYRTLLREIDGLELYANQLQAQVASLDGELETVRRESSEIDRTNIEILPLMHRMLSTLGQFVALDLPFLVEDRKARIARLEELMPRADVTVSEKYRRIVEAYQIEVEYGRTIEAYRADLEGRTVDFLRVGRVALMYQTPDGAETGYWDNEQKSWERDDHYAESVSAGLRIARKQSSPDLLVVPVAAASAGA